MRQFARIAPIGILLVLMTSSAFAQEVTPAMLPADTSFVVFSHSSSQIRAAAASNPMVQTWYGPQSAQTRRILVQYIVSQMAPNSNGQKYNLTQENADRLLSVLENSFVIGMSKTPDIMAMATQLPSSKQGDVLNMTGFFLILDTAGKETQFGLLWPALVAALPKEIAHTQMDIAGTTLDKFAGPNNTTFAAQVGSRFVWSNQQKLMGELIGRLKSGTPSGNSLAENPEFQRCQAHSVPGVVMDAFIRFPDLSKIPIPANPQFDVASSVQALHLDSIHGLCGNVSMTPEGELMRWAILGDTSQGNLLSWLGSNRNQFETLALAPAASTSISVASFDLSALYKTFKIALAAGMPGRQQASADLAEGMLSMQLGMPLTDVLGVFRGEFASIKFASQSSGTQQVFALTIANPDRILDLIHKFAPKNMSDETQESGVTFFKINAPIPAAVSSQPPMPETYVALSSRLLLLSGDKNVLREMVARASSTSGAGGGPSILDNPDVRRMRAMLPAELLGFSITDYTTNEWQKEISDALANSGEQDKSKITPEQAQLMESLKRIPWASLLGGIHWGVGAWWKDADGIFFETRVQ